MKEEDKSSLQELFDKKQWEAFHEVYDLLIERRLRELDPTFMKEIEDIAAEATFWYS